MANSLVLVRSFPLPLAASLALSAEDHVMFNSAGDLVLLADTSGAVYAGQLEQDADNSAGIAGAVNGNVRAPAGEYHRFVASGASKAWHGKSLFAVNGTTLALAATTTNDVCVGRCWYCESATSVIVNTADRAALPSPA